MTRRRSTTSERKDVARYPFSLSAAYKLMAIAECGFWNSVPNVDQLPASWGTLNVLSRIAPVRISKLMESGAVHPMMTRAEASNLAGAKPANRGDEDDRISAEGRRGQISAAFGVGNRWGLIQRFFFYD